MDYDHPYRDRLPVIRQYCVALVFAACACFVWALDDVVDFVALRAQATTTAKAVVIDYEVAGGKERIRVQVSPASEPSYFMLVDPAARGPRYASGETVELFSYDYANSAGQALTRTLAYSRHTYWVAPAKKALVSLLIFAAAVVGFRWPVKNRVALAGHPA